MTLPKSSSFNKIVTLDLKEFSNKYVLWMVDSFSRFIQGKLISNKKVDTNISTLTDTWCMSFRFPTSGFFMDNGGKFRNMKMEEFGSKVGIKIEFSTAYSP